MLKEFGTSLYLADGPTVPFFGFPYPTRMAIAQLSEGGLWVWSPIELSPGLDRAVGALGPVRHIVSPNKIHHLKRRPDLHFNTDLGDEADSAWAADIDQTIFRGSFAMEEVAFFHRPSRSAIFGDLVQRHDPAKMKGFTRLLMRLDGLVGEHGSTPREWRASFLRRSSARLARARVLVWEPEKLVIAHGACAREDATRILARALAWM